MHKDEDIPETKVPIVLIHGLFGNLKAVEITRPFGTTPVYTPDLIGYGDHEDANTSELTLDDQAQHVAEFIQSNCKQTVNLVGHSIGGAVAALVAHQYPDLITSYTSVEGNFTLKDAFWSNQIAAQSLSNVENILQDYKDDPDAWFLDAGVKMSDFTSRLARDWLNNQPASTLLAQTKAVIAATDHPSYLTNIEALMSSQMPVYLIAGERSATGWDTPAWANEKCTLRINIPNTGHMMMAEKPDAFARAVLCCVGFK